MNIIDARRQLWIEECWLEGKPVDPATGEQVTKYEMIKMAITGTDKTKANRRAFELLIETQTTDLADEDFRSNVFHWWEQHLQDYLEFFEEAA